MSNALRLLAGDNQFFCHSGVAGCNNLQFYIKRSLIFQTFPEAFWFPQRKNKRPNWLSRDAARHPTGNK